MEFTIIVAIIALFALARSIRIINQYEKGLVMRLGKYHTTADAVIYYKVVDPVKAEFEIADFGYATTTLAQTNLRNLIGDKQLDETLTARDVINTSLREVLDEATNPWGVKITKVELQKIDPPADITSAMSQQMKAEREKRARILEAQGFREAAILKAEGDAKAQLLTADSQSRAIEMVAKAAEKNFTDRAAN